MISLYLLDGSYESTVHDVVISAGNGMSSSSVVWDRQGSKDEHHTCGKVASQETKSGFQPSWWGSRYTMPQRLTVAGEATAKSPTCMATMF